MPAVRHLSGIPKAPHAEIPEHAEIRKADRIVRLVYRRVPKSLDLTAL